MPKKGIASALAVAAGATLLAGCGEAKEGASFAPAGSALYAEVEIQPQGEQKQNLDAILRKFPELGNPGQRIAQEFDKAAQRERSPVRWNKDVKPWLGEKASVFVAKGRAGQPAAAGLIASKDDGKAQDTLEQAAKEERDAKRSFEGRDYWYDSQEQSAYGVVDGQVVVGNEAGFRAAVNASKGEPLADSEAFDGAWGELPDDRIAGVYQDNPKLADVLGSASPQANTQQLKRVLSRGPRTATTWAKLEQDGLVAESESPARGGFATAVLGRGTEILETLPGDSWLAVGAPDVGKTLSGLIDSFAGSGGRQLAAQQVQQATGLDLDRDLLSWMGDFGLFAQGTSRTDLGGGVVIQSKDPATSERALKQLASAARRQGQGRVEIGRARLPGADTGFEIGAPNLPQAIIAGQGDDRVVAAYGDKAARAGLAGKPSLADEPDYKQATGALGGGFQPSSYISIAPIVDLASTFGATQSPQFAQGEKYLRRFSFLVAGTKKEGDKIRSRLKLSLR
jgi:hypothetical protein